MNTPREEEYEHPLPIFFITFRYFEGNLVAAEIFHLVTEYGLIIRPVAAAGLVHTLAQLQVHLWCSTARTQSIRR